MSAALPTALVAFPAASLITAVGFDELRFDGLRFDALGFDELRFDALGRLRDGAEPPDLADLRELADLRDVADLPGLDLLDEPRERAGGSFVPADFFGEALVLVSAIFSS